MKTSELKEMTIGDLKEKIYEQEELYAKMKMNNSISPLENPLTIRSTRRDLARLKTELTARKVAAVKQEK